MFRFAVLEVEQQAVGMPRREADRAAITMLRQRMEKERVTSAQAATGTVAMAVGRHEVMNQAGPDHQFGREDPVAMPFLSEVEQQAERTSRWKADEAAVTSQWQCTNERRVTPVLAATDAAAVAPGRLEAMCEAGPNYLYSRKEPIEMPPWSESDQQAVGTSRREADGAAATLLQQSLMKKV